MSTTEERSAEPRRGEWSRNPMAPAIPELTPHQELALLARMLFRWGYDDGLSGHITYKQDDGTLLVNPFGLTWDELRGSDVMRIDLEGRTLDGPWTVTPAIKLHTELHKARDDVRVAVHNHPRWSTLWCNARRVPPIYDQTSAQLLDDIALYDEFDGPVAMGGNAVAAVAALGDKPVALLANHGVFVTAPDVRRAYHRAWVIEWRSRQAWHTEALGGGVTLTPEVATSFGELFETPMSFPGFFEAMVRRELRHDPSVLE